MEGVRVRVNLTCLGYDRTELSGRKLYQEVPEYLLSDYFSFVVTAFSKTFLFSEFHHGDNPARKPKLKM